MTEHLQEDSQPEADRVDGDVLSDSTDLVEWEPPLPAVRPMSILDVRVVDPPSQWRSWLDECRGGIEVRAHATAVHAVRLPLYGGRASRYSGRGLMIAASCWWRWVRDVEALTLRRELSVDSSLAPDVRIRRHMEAHADRRTRVRVRWGVTLGCLLTGPLLVRLLWHTHPVITVALLVAVVVGLGLLGAQRHDIVPYEPAPQEFTLSVDLVVQAFVDAGITKWDRPVTVMPPGPVREKQGHAVAVLLPSGSTFADVLKAHDRLASGLHCPKQCLDLDDLPDQQEGMLELFIASKPPSKLVVPSWPLLDVDRFDIFRPIPMGWTTRGQVVCLSLMWVHSLIGAAPRRGKSTILRMLCLATLLDPRAHLIVVDFAGGLDYTAFRPFCLRFIHGPEAAQIQEFLALLTWLDQEYNRRQAALSRLPVHKAPEARLTPALAELPEFAPIVVAVDEFQVATLAPKIGEDIVSKWTELEKVCPKVGITFVAATQSADDSVPTALRNIALQRVALTMASYQASMAILGNTAQKLGYDASTLGGTPGLGYSWGTDSGDIDGHRGKVRFANCTPADASVLLERIARLRTRVSVEVIDDPEAIEAKQVPSIVAAALRAWPRPAMNCHQDVLAEAMHLDQVDLGRFLRELGIPAEPVKMRRPGEDRTSAKRGYRLVDLEAVTR